MSGLVFSGQQWKRLQFNPFESVQHQLFCSHLSRLSLRPPQKVKDYQRLHFIRAEPPYQGWKHLYIFRHPYVSTVSLLKVEFKSQMHWEKGWQTWQPWLGFRAKQKWNFLGPGESLVEAVPDGEKNFAFSSIPNNVRHTSNSEMDVGNSAVKVSNSEKATPLVTPKRRHLW